MQFVISFLVIVIPIFYPLGSKWFVKSIHDFNNHAKKSEFTNIFEFTDAFA